MRVHYLIGKENFIDHVSCVKDHGYLYWKKSNKKMELGDIVYLFISGKPYNRVMYKLEVSDTDVPRDDSQYYRKAFTPDSSCYRFTVVAEYNGECLVRDELEKHGIRRHVQYKMLDKVQADWIAGCFE